MTISIPSGPVATSFLPRRIPRPPSSVVPPDGVSRGRLPSPPSNASSRPVTREPIASYLVSNRPAGQRCQSAPVTRKEMESLVQRLTQPTLSFRAKTHLPRLVQSSTSNTYTWSVSGINAFRDNNKVLYTHQGAYKRCAQR